MTDFQGTELYSILGELGKKFLEMRGVLDEDNSDGSYNPKDYMWLGDVAVYYDDEVIGYLSIEDNWCNFHKAELKDEK